MDGQTRKYIENCRANKMTDDEIFFQLTQGGWKSTDANAVLGRSDQVQKPKQEFNFQEEYEARKNSKWSLIKKIGKTNLMPTQLSWIQWILGSSVAYNLFNLYTNIKGLNMAKEIDEVTQKYTQTEIDNAINNFLKINITITSIISILNIIAIIGIQTRKKWAFYLTMIITSLYLLSSFYSFDIISIALCVAILTIIFRSKDSFE